MKRSTRTIRTTRQTTLLFVALLTGLLVFVGCDDGGGGGGDDDTSMADTAAGDTTTGDTTTGDTTTGDTGGGDAGDGDTAMSTVCEDYCSTVTANCTGANAQYTDEAECLTACEGMTEGDPSDTATDSVYCRLYHAGAPAQVDPAFHCDHAGQDGGGVCVDDVTACDRFCGNVLENCAPGTNYEVYADATECTTACEAFDDTGDFGAESGDTLQCRDRYGQLAFDDPILCLLAAEDGGGVCVDETADMRVDRIGRPAINTALIASAHKDIYNFATPAKGSFFIEEMSFFLQAIDNLDNDDTNGLGPAVLGSHDALAELLAADILLYNATATDCTDGYLAVELGITGNCGGRTLEQDVIDVTLQALVDAGDPPDTVVTDAVDADDATVSTDFPYLAPAGSP